MKIQDIIFLLIFIFMLYRRRYEWIAMAGLVCIIVAIPFFSFWIFFTGQRLTYYAFFFLLLACLLFLFKKR